jgi:hypothetical protein
LAKKRKKAPRQPQPAPSKRFNPETSPYFVPIVFALLFVLMVILFSEFLFSDQMLYGSDMITAGIFMRSIFIEHLKATGHILQWDPYMFGGIPFVEAFHGDIFYPFSILKFFGTLYRMIGINLFIHIYLAGIFMYLCARQFRLSKVASLLAGICYMFSPYLVSLVAPGHDGKIFVTTLFPLVILFLERGFQKRPFLNFTLAGLFIGIIIVSPHPQMSYFMLWTVAFYSAFKLIVKLVKEKSIVPVIRPALLVVYAVVIGLLISAVQFYPGYEYTTKFSPRADAKRGWDWATSWSMHQEGVLSLLIPEFVGANTQERDSYYWGKNAFKDNSEAAGTVTILMALAGFLFYRRKESYFFGGLAIFALLYALGGTTPVFRLFYWIIPKVSSMRSPSMIMFLFSFSASLLAAMGLQWVMDTKGEKDKQKREERFYYLLFGIPALLLMLAFLFSVAGKGMLNLWTSVFYSDASRIMVQEGVSKLDVAYMNLPAIQSGAWFAFLATAFVAVCVWMYRKSKAGVAILVVMLAVPAFNEARFDSRFIGTFDPQRQWAPNVLTNFFTSKTEKFRVLYLLNPKETILPYHDIEVIVGYHGNQLRWYDDLIGGMNLANIAPRPNPHVINLANGKYIVARSQVNFPSNYFGAIPLKTAADFGQVKIIENDNALPRAFLVDEYRVIPDRQDIYPLIDNGADNLRETVYLEKEPDLSIVSDSASADSAWIASYATDSVIVGVQAATNKLLVLTDNYYDAWHAYIDGKPAEILRADGSFRAVAIPAGTKQVLFKYRSSRYETGAWVTVLTLIYVLGILGFYFVRSRRHPEEEEIEE